jgi:hypothetical protein
MLGVVLIVGVPMGWWARKAQLQRAAVARIVAAGGAVVYDFEIIDPSGGTTPEATTRVNEAGYYSSPSTATPPSQPWRDWARKTLGVDYVASVTQVIVAHAEKLQDDDLALLADLPKLEFLYLDNSPIGDRWMVHLGKLRGLKSLKLDVTRLTEAGLAQLDGLDGLESVSLSYHGSPTTDADLARLKTSKKLRTVKLNISVLKISDELLTSLEGFTNLECLMITTGDIKPEAITRLNAALPKLGILLIHAHPPWY